MQADELEVIVRAGRKRRLYVPEDAHRVELGTADVERLIPHRDPFRLVDRIDAVDLSPQSLRDCSAPHAWERVGGTIAGRRWLDPADPLFRGHFPGDPIYPGALQVEAIGQLGLCLFALERGPAAGVRALKIHHAAFLDAIRPGAELVLLARSLDASDYTGVCAGQVLVGDSICCLAVMEVYFVEA